MVTIPARLTGLAERMDDPDLNTKDLARALGTPGPH